MTAIETCPICGLTLAACEALAAQWAAEDGLEDGRTWPFTNGADFADWTEANCNSCALRSVVDAVFPCDIERELVEALFNEDAGIPREIARRAHLPVTISATQACPERLPVEAVS